MPAELYSKILLYQQLLSSKLINGGDNRGSKGVPFRHVPLVLMPGENLLACGMNNNAIVQSLSTSRIRGNLKAQIL